MTAPFVWVPSTEFMCQDFFCAHLQEPAAWPEEKVSEFCGNSEVFSFDDVDIWSKHQRTLMIIANMLNRHFVPTKRLTEALFWKKQKYIDAQPAQTFFPQTTRKVLWLGGILQVMMVAFFGAAATWPGRNNNDLSLTFLLLKLCQNRSISEHGGHLFSSIEANGSAAGWPHIPHLTSWLLTVMWEYHSYGCFQMLEWENMDKSLFSWICWIVSRNIPFETIHLWSHKSE